MRPTGGCRKSPHNCPDLTCGNSTVPDIERAFAMEAQEFEECYRFPKPPTDASNIVVGCLAGKRAIMAINKLRDGFGYTSLM